MRPDRGDAAFLQDMVEAGEAIVRYTAGKSRTDYDSNEMLRDAVERRVEIFGEAARRLSPSIQAAHPELPWRKIMGTRHILAHDYDIVDPDIVWRIATLHIPEALTQIRPLIPPPPASPS
jgi:uncharacterized protein with HEPN domain